MRTHFSISFKKLFRKITWGNKDKFYENQTPKKVALLEAKIMWSSTLISSFLKFLFLALFESPNLIWISTFSPLFSSSHFISIKFCCSHYCFIFLICLKDQNFVSNVNNILPLVEWIRLSFLQTLNLLIWARV